VHANEQQPPAEFKRGIFIRGTRLRFWSVLVRHWHRLRAEAVDIHKELSASPNLSLL